MKNIEVVAAIIKKDGKIFCARRADKGELALKWEFPGGKIEENEGNEVALKREILEELNTEIVIDDYLMTVKHQYSSFHLTMHAYMCRVEKGNLELNEHVESCLLSIEELVSLDWAAADVPIVNKLKEINK